MSSSTFVASWTRASCDLSLASGESLLAVGEIERVIADIGPRALAFAEHMGDRNRAFRACRLVLDCLLVEEGGFNAAQAEYLVWAERATEYAKLESIERSHADLALAWARISRGQFSQARIATGGTGTRQTAC